MPPLSETYFYPTDIHGHTVRLPSHRAIQWLRDPSFERERIRTMAQVIQPTDVVLDIGAEQGDMSALIASWVPDGGVILVEPNDKVWPCIRATFEENKLPLNMPGPLGSFVGFCGASGEGYAPGGWPDCADGTIDPAAGFCHMAEQSDIPVATVDGLARKTTYAPNVITIDVEGAELEVLKGACDTLTLHKPEVFVSVHPAFMRHHFDQRPQDVFDLLEHYGYRCHVIGADHEVHVWATPARHRITTSLL